MAIPHASAPASQSNARLVFQLLGGAFAWTIHFLASYALVAIGCSERWEGVSTIVLAITVAFAAVAAWAAIDAYRTWRSTNRSLSWDLALNEPGGWHAFLLTMGALLSVVSLAAILLEGASSFVNPVCTRSGAWFG